MYPQFGAYITNGFNEWGSWYDGAALRVQKRYSHGLSYLVSYTYSHNLDYVDNLKKVSRGDITRYLTAYVIDKPYVMGVLVSPGMRKQLGL